MSTGWGCLLSSLAPSSRLILASGTKVHNYYDLDSLVRSNHADTIKIGADSCYRHGSADRRANLIATVTEHSASA